MSYLKIKNKHKSTRDAPIEPLDPSPVKIVLTIISSIIKHLYSKIINIKNSIDKIVVSKIVEYGRKIINDLNGRRIRVNPFLSIQKMTKYIKNILNIHKSKISDSIKKIIAWSLIMLDMANKQYRQQQSQGSETKALSALDSKKLIDLYNDSAAILKTLGSVKKIIKFNKYIDDRRRISTTKTPTMWERKFVLGIKPGVQFNEKDWKAYKENGFIVMENKRNGQKYQKPQHEVIAAANAEREEKMIREDPYLKSGNIQYGDPSESPKTKRSLLQILKTIAATIAAVTVVVNEIKTLHTSSEGLRSILLNFANGAVTWLRNAKEAWKQVNNRVKT